MDDRALDRDVAGAAAAHQALLAMLDECLAAGDLDGVAPSRLPGWTVGHVVTHLARNADSMVRVFEAAGRVETVDRYPAGPAGRDAEIDAGAGRDPAELVGDVRATIWRLEAAWSRTAWDGSSRELGGREIPLADLPFLRWREVEVHRVDLGLGAEFADWPAAYVRIDLRQMEMRWNARRPMGMTGLPPEALAADPTTRLAWLLGRTEIDGLAPAAIF